MQALRNALLGSAPAPLWVISVLSAANRDGHSRPRSASRSENVSFASRSERYGEGVRFYGRGGTKPVPPLYADASTGVLKQKRDYVDAAFRYIKEDASIKTVILCARWVTILRTESLKAHKSTERQSTKTADTIAQREAFLAESLEQMIRELNQLGKRVILLYPIPDIGVNVPQLVASKILHPQKVFETPSYDECLDRQEPIFRIFDRLAAQPGLLRLRPHRYFIEKEKVVFEEGRRPFYHDDHHLSLTGSQRLVPLFEQILSGTAVDSPSEVSHATSVE